MYSMRLIHWKKGKKKEEKLCLRIEYACIRINVSSYTFIFYKC